MYFIVARVWNRIVSWRCCQAALPRIKEALEQGNVVVHCSASDRRAPVLLVAIAAAMQGVSPVKLLEWVGTVRPCMYCTVLCCCVLRCAVLCCAAPCFGQYPLIIEHCVAFCWAALYGFLCVLYGTYCNALYGVSQCDVLCCRGR